MTAPRSLVLTCALALVLALPACSGDGSVTRPTLPSLNVPTKVPSLNVPTKVPSLNVPTLTIPTRRSSPDQAEPQTVPVTPSESATGPGPDKAEGSGSTWWPWLLAALVLIALAAGYLALRVRRRNAAWDKRLGDAQEQAAWFEGSLTAQLQGQATAAEAAAMWNAAQPRLLQFDQDLHAMISDAPDDDRRARARILRERVAELARAQGAEASVSGMQSVDEMRSLRLAVDRARAALRDVLPTQR